MCWFFLESSKTFCCVDKSFGSDPLFDNQIISGLLQEFSSFEKRMVEILKQVPLPKAVHDTLWEQCVRIANRTFVEG